MRHFTSLLLTLCCVGLLYMALFVMLRLGAPQQAVPTPEHHGVSFLVRLLFVLGFFAPPAWFLVAHLRARR